MGRTKRNYSNWDDDYYDENSSFQKRNKKSKKKDLDWKDIRKAKIRNMERENENNEYYDL